MQILQYWLIMETRLPTQYPMNSESDEIEPNGVKTVEKFCSQKFLISFLCSYTMREGLGTANLFVGVAGNDITVNIKDGATRNNSKQYIQILP